MKLSPLDSQYIEAWLMPEEVQNLKDPNRIYPSLGKSVPVTVEDLSHVGISYWKIDSEALASPVRNIHWDDRQVVDDDIRNNYQNQHEPCSTSSYANIIHLDTDDFLNASSSKSCKASLTDGHDRHHGRNNHLIPFQDHLCYLTFGSGFLDVKDDDCESWIRMRVTRGDLITLPDGLYHRFTEAPCEGGGNSNSNGTCGPMADVGYFAGQHYRTPLVRIIIEGRNENNNNQGKKSSTPSPPSPASPLTPQAV